MSNLNHRRVLNDLEIAANSTKSLCRALSFLHESFVASGNDAAGILLLLSNSAFKTSEELAELAEKLAGLTALATPRTAETVDAMPADTGGFNQDLAAFKLAVVKFWNAGITGYGAIATALEAGGYRNSNGNLYTRETVKRTLIRAGLVAETGKATKENSD